ncbi:M15 family metallopeptidase [Gemmiger formicilis]|uniref:M15 family metallopeptidase n=1 Tax=Gemmiger formicilis TaxID=745368 RepID=UPI001959CFE8|nr:M15 family metallopeptidase [Gemmiger formicilis]MBM6716756.1 M15 family metallopeptidase [Gemmiger formicilis]
MRPAELHLTAAGARKGSLILVNRDHPLQGELFPDLVPLQGGWPDQHLDRTAARMLDAAIRAVQGTGQILPVSGWRSQDEQQAIWNSSLTDHGPDFTARYVARPGCSEHQTGLAVDLALCAEHIDFIRPEFPYDGVCGTFRKVAARYGFIQRYTEEKQDKTGIAAEPWHFRYVGVPHAAILTEAGLCLEEYPAFLRQAPRVVRLENGRRVQVSYLPWTGTETRRPAPGACWQLSGTNEGGFILTVWEGEA